MQIVRSLAFSLPGFLPGCLPDIRQPRIVACDQLALCVSGPKPEVLEDFQTSNAKANVLFEQLDRVFDKFLSTGEQRLSLSKTPSGL